jgi:predicted Holliday junction resolvase-like endonuclease
LNILTKICVVVLLILVLIASVVFINMATVPVNYRELYEKSQTQAALATQSARTSELVAKRQDQEIQSLIREKNDLNSTIADMRKKLVPDPVETQSKELMAKLQEAETHLAKLSADFEAAGKRNDLLAKQLEDARTEIIKHQKQIAEQIGKITEVSGELQRSERVVRALEQQLRDRDEKIKDIETQLATRGGAGESGAVQAAPQGQVTGTITAVRGEHASINVGAAQGVARGQKYYIYRNANFVGYLVIDETDEGEAAGTIIDKQLDPVIGDKITNDLKK